MEVWHKIPKRLTQGGFLKDHENKLCKHGDIMLFCIGLNSGYEHGILRWNPGEGAFLIDPVKGGNSYYLWELSEWKKEE